MIQPRQQRILRWMKREVQEPGSVFVDRITNEVRTTALAEHVADKWDGVYLDDDQDPVWDLAVEVAYWWEDLQASIQEGMEAFDPETFRLNLPVE